MKKYIVHMKFLLTLRGIIRVTLKLKRKQNPLRKQAEDNITKLYKKV